MQQLAAELVAQLRTLDFFNNIEEISQINSGLSGHCFKVQTQQRLYFAKSLQHSHAAHIELQLHQQAAKEGLSPAICYRDQNWLITDFNQGDELSKAELSLEDKLGIAVELMFQFHQLPSEQLTECLSRLDITKTINDLLETNLYSSSQIDLITQIGQQLADNLIVEYTTFCHGDINFTNVLVAQNTQLIYDKKVHFLIDFECACLADVEYDIAMLLAINTIDKQYHQLTIDRYKALSKNDKNMKIPPKKVTRYLCFCYLINGLWFYNKFKQKQDNNMLFCATTQFNLFDQLGIFKVNLSQQMR